MMKFYHFFLTTFFFLLFASCGGGTNNTDQTNDTEQDSIVEPIDSVRVEMDTIPPFVPVASQFDHDSLVLPEGFTYKVLFSEKTDQVKRADGVYFPAKGKHDLSVFIPDDEDPENKGILYISHETSGPNADLGDGGGATVFDIEKKNGSWEVVGDFHHIDFSSIGFTDRNCGGSLGPNGNVFTCEETWGYNNEYFTKKGLKDRSFETGLPMWQNIGYVVEVDPRERKVVKRHMTMGKLVHEDVLFTNDGKTCYITDDYSPGVFMKLEMPSKGAFDEGQLYAYKQSEDGESGEWLTIPMDTSSLVNCRKVAVEKGATLIIRHEWVEEINGKLYISETGEDHFSWKESMALGGTVPDYVRANLAESETSFDDPFGRIVEFDPATNRMSSYLEGGFFSDSSGCFSNPDCNTSVSINGKHYLVISEDINWYDRGRAGEDAATTKDFYNEIYFLDMSIEEPVVDDLLRFCVAPRGSETTGVIFLPDGSMVVNIQHPKAGNKAPFNRSVTVLIEGF
jgi:hypothetical protein